MRALTTTVMGALTTGLTTTPAVAPAAPAVAPAAPAVAATVAAQRRPLTAGRRALRFLVYQVLVLLILLCLSVGTAWAQEVPAGVTTVRISVVLPAESAIAGGEIGFTQTGGLEYKKFVPASGVQNPVKATVGDVTYVGFFSADNDYKPADGGIIMGDLEFSYKGDGAEQVVLQEIRLHTKDADDVDTQTLNPGTVYSVTRAGDTGGEGSGTGGEGEGSGTGGEGGSGEGESGGGSGGSGGEGTGGSGSGGGTGGGGSGSGGSGSGGSGGSGDGGWGTVADNDGNALVDENGNPVVELTPDSSTGTGGAGNTGTGTAAPGSPGTGSGSGGTALDDATTPLTSTSPADDKAQVPLGWFLGGAAVLVLIALVAIIFWRRRRQNQEGLQDDR